MKPLVIITRPEADAIDAAADITALGFHSLLQPLMIISGRVWDQPDWQKVAGLIVTSGNAVPHIAMCEAIKSKPVFVVGARTADKLRAAGFHHVKAVVERSLELPALIMPALKPEAGCLMHLTSQYMRDDFHETSGAAGYELDKRFVYKADAVESLNADTLAALQSKQDILVLFYSPRSASLFQGLLRQYGLSPHLRALCLSPAVAQSCGKDVFSDIQVASVPTHGAMVEALARF